MLKKGRTSEKRRFSGVHFQEFFQFSLQGNKTFPCNEDLFSIANKSYLPSCNMDKQFFALLFTTTGTIFHFLDTNDGIPDNIHFSLFTIICIRFKEGFSTQHAFMRLTEKWIKRLDTPGVVGTILMDLSKAYDYLPYNLIMSKLEAYGLDVNSLRLRCSYLNNRPSNA